MDITEIKLKADKLWEIFELEGILESLKVIEQITYLLFLRILDTESIKPELSVKQYFSERYTFDSDSQPFRWSNLLKLSAEELHAVMYLEVPEYIELQCMSQPEIFKYFTGIQIRVEESKSLKKAMKIIDEIVTTSDFELRYFYEYLLTKKKTNGELGRFPTPRNIIKLLVEILNPQKNEIICDPGCGTGGFLIGVLAYLTGIESNIIGTPEKSLTPHHAKNLFEESFEKKIVKEFLDSHLFGVEQNTNMIRIATMNLMLLGTNLPNLYQENVLAEGLNYMLPYQQENFFDVIFAFPSITGTIDNEVVDPKLFNRYRTKNPNLLYLGLILDMLKENGRAAFILPTDILTVPGRSYREIRKQLVERNNVLGVLSLGNTVKLSKNSDLSVIIFQKGGRSKNVFFYDLSKEIKDYGELPIYLSDELHMCLKSWQQRDSNAQTDRGARSFFVKLEDIIESDYCLSFDRHKISQYETDKFDSPETMIEQFDVLCREIQSDSSEIKRMLK